MADVALIWKEGKSASVANNKKVFLSKLAEAERRVQDFPKASFYTKAI